MLSDLTKHAAASKELPGTRRRYRTPHAGSGAAALAAAGAAAVGGITARAAASAAVRAAA